MPPNAADLKQFALLSELSESEREALLDVLEFEQIRKGRSIYRETGEADGLVFLVSGTVRLISKRCNSDGQAGAGSVLGVGSLFTMGGHEASAKAETPCEVLLLPRTSYRRLVEDEPIIGCRLAEAVAAELGGLLRHGLDTLIGPRGE